MDLRATKDVLHARVQDGNMVVDFGSDFVFRESETITIREPKVLLKTVAFGKQMVVDLNAYTFSIGQAKDLACLHARGQSLSIRQISVVQPSPYSAQLHQQRPAVLYAYDDGAMHVEGVECSRITVKLSQLQKWVCIDACLE